LKEKAYYRVFTQSRNYSARDSSQTGSASDSFSFCFPAKSAANTVLYCSQLARNTRVLRFFLFVLSAFSRVLGPFRDFELFAGFLASKNGENVGGWEVYDDFFVFGL